MAVQRLDYEEIRLSYKPDEVRVLFVGESRPESDKFFYLANSPLMDYTQQALADVFEEVASLRETAFLSFFKSIGFYLEDLCQEPINGKKGSQRKKLCKAGVPCLSRKIDAWRPKAVIALLLGIEKCVRKAIDQSGLDVEFTAVPFAGNSWQNEYVSEMSEFLRRLKEKGLLSSPAK